MIQVSGNSSKRATSRHQAHETTVLKTQLLIISILIAGITGLMCWVAWNASNAQLIVRTKTNYEGMCDLGFIRNKELDYKNIRPFFLAKSDTYQELGFLLPAYQTSEYHLFLVTEPASTESRFIIDSIQMRSRLFNQTLTIPTNQIRPGEGISRFEYVGNKILATIPANQRYPYLIIDPGVPTTKVLPFFPAKRISHLGYICFFNLFSALLMVFLFRKRNR